MQRRPSPLALLLAAALAASPALAREPRAADPVINAPYLTPDYGAWVERFESEGREVYDQRHRIVAASGVKPGMTVADVGAGTGLFTYLFARAVGPTGQVIAVDVSRPFMERLAARARAQRLDNVRTVVNWQDSVGLPPASVDLVFTSDTYHHFEYPRATLASIHRALKPGGTFVVIDFQRIPGVSQAWILDHVRAGRETTVREIEAAGFKLREEVPLLRENYYLKFVKTPNRPAAR